MTKVEPNDDARVRRFLLGEMTDDERSAFEENFIADDGLFDRIRVIEDEITEAYTRGTLSPSEIKKFERNFLTTDRRRERVAFAGAMLIKIAETRIGAVVKKTETVPGEKSLRDWLSGIFRLPNLAFAAVIAVFTMIIGGWLVLRNPGADEVAKEVFSTPEPIHTAGPATPMPVPKVDESIPSSNGANNKTSNKTHTANANREAPNANDHLRSVSSPVLALFSGAVRSGGKMPELTVPENAAGVNLQLNLESQDYKTYQVDIVDPDGAVVFHGGTVGAKNSIVNLFVPATSLRTNDYIVKVSGIKPKSETESVADFPFRVIRK